MTKDGIDPIARFAGIRRQLEARWPETRIAPTLDRIRVLTELLGDPQRAYPVVHVTGTNGKTSTARMIESLLRSFGLHTGLMTSPHLSDLRERICLDGEPIELERFLQVYDEVVPVLALADEMSIREGGPALSFFEVMTALGFAAFADAPVDVAIIEVGMGGSWDATNVADGTVAVITPIGLDHREYLGETIADVAGEKAGIIKPGAVAVVAAQPLQAAEVLGERAREMSARVLVEGIDFGVAQRTVALGGQQVLLSGVGGTYEELFLPLFGAHQAQNAATALAAVEAFFGAADHQVSGRGDGSQAVEEARPVRQLDPTMVRIGFAEARSPGRLEVVRRAPTVVVDAAHNPHGAAALARAIDDSFSFASLVGVLGVLAGKDAAGICRELEPVLDHVVITKPSSPRAVPVEELATIAKEVFGDQRVSIAGRLDEALELAIAQTELATPSGVGGGVLVTGSVLTVSEARLLLGAEAGWSEGESQPEHGAARAMDPDQLERSLQTGEIDSYEPRWDSE